MTIGENIRARRKELCISVDELAEKMKWCVEHKDQIEQTGRNARVVYERYFSMEAFEHHLTDLIEDHI